MLVDEVKVQNFRCIRNEVLKCRTMTSLVGPNGSGKSTFLRALELFYDQNPEIEKEDIYGMDTEQSIEITVIFNSLEDEAKERFGDYIRDSRLKITRIIELVDEKTRAKYHGYSPRNPDFTKVREAGYRDPTIEAYREIREEYPDLPSESAKGRALKALDKWERDHADELDTGLDEGEFFSYGGGSEGDFSHYSRYILVPAVQDATDEAAEKRGSALSEILDYVVRNVIEEEEHIRKLRSEFRERYREEVNPSELDSLTTFQDQVEASLKGLVPGAGLSFTWQRPEINLPQPQANLRVQEGGFETSVERTGHGFQRALILTLLQYLSVIRGAGSINEGGEESEDLEIPELLLCIEEPEVFQHPNRQRNFAETLYEIAGGRRAGVARRTQILIATHSPLFINLDYFDCVRRLQKVPGEDGMPKETKVSETTLQAIAEELEAIEEDTEDYTDDGLRARLEAIMTPRMNEGFFADAIVLVEGPQDRAALSGTASALGFDLGREGITVIPCGGKDNLDRPYLIFSRLGIPCYILWDNDRGGDGDTPQKNRKLLRLVGAQETDWPSDVTSDYAVFEPKLEKVLKREIGADNFQSLLDPIKQTYGFSKNKDALKRGAVVKDLLERSDDDIEESVPTLVEIIERVRARANGSQ